MKTILALGPCRSGTSMLSGVLVRLGVYMGDENKIQNWKYLNDYGCYEDEDFVDLVRRIVISSGSHLSWFEHPSKKEILKVKGKFDSEIKKIITGKKKKLWGWKFPWTAAVLPLLESYLVNPYSIVMVRDTDAIAKSIYNKFDDKKNFFQNILLILNTRAFWNPAFLIKRLLDFLSHKTNYKNTKKLSSSIKGYYEMINENVKGKKALYIKYDDLLSKPEKEIKRIIKFLDIKPTKNQMNNALRFVHPELKHF